MQCGVATRRRRASCLFMAYTPQQTSQIVVYFGSRFLVQIFTFAHYSRIRSCTSAMDCMIPPLESTTIRMLACGSLSGTCMRTRLLPLRPARPCRGHNTGLDDSPNVFGAGLVCSKGVFPALFTQEPMLAPTSDASSCFLYLSSRYCLALLSLFS